ncbi:hypothetical protein [Yersinia phage fPS-19]|uniref:Uncharacterized protein n=14 Tax=Helsettvirus TaxID=2732684 RepID=A0A2D0PEI1_9CAUD|nr:hypothetical protein HOS88_gp16 [Yersinia phage fPS-9]YP_009799143.1 hypothetical protein HOS90_gp16 [Yersinia phage fPS-53]SOO46349.1 hypothetical protein [Yersinia phage fPS-52]SOO46398.1 hypothetical protein [Yersinia phage fPS-19]SOO46449.1 hypothetical protein [Yersinia phage fPS-26]SOO46500.1 hypothetical protein [Yersinia phage fPS-7]SOO46602.1 hypothetical protein [Yersinia phage fPS-89]SOO46652.1 hypothetical protein [Yersinia phage fPS-86]SOO46704.1 hypothetical protein [Yersin
MSQREISDRYCQDTWEELHEKELELFRKRLYADFNHKK